MNKIQTKSPLYPFPCRIRTNFEEALICCVDDYFLASWALSNLFNLNKQMLNFKGYYE